MHNEMNEKISRLLDGDLEHLETLDLLKKIQANESLRQKMCRYQSISQAVKTEAFHPIDTDFSRKIYQEIQQEPSYLLPQLKSRSDSNAQPEIKPNKRIWLAVAASTVVAAVLVGQVVQNQKVTSNSANVTAMSTTQLSLPASYPQAQNPKQHNRRPLNTQFNDYLQAHNSSVYTNGEAVFQPYARVASYGRD